MRLIDADALSKTLERLWNVHDDQEFCNKDVWRELENAPTIETKQKAKVDAQHQVGDHGRVYEYGACGACGAPVIKPDKYCSECGARLEWK